MIKNQLFLFFRRTLCSQESLGLEKAYRLSVLVYEEDEFRPVPGFPSLVRSRLAKSVTVRSRGFKSLSRRHRKRPFSRVRYARAKPQRVVVEAGSALPWTWGKVPTALIDAAIVYSLDYFAGYKREG